MDIPPAIANLHLCHAFKGYATKVTDCIETTSDTIFYVIDDSSVGYSRFVNSKEMSYGYFTGYNPHPLDITLLSIDNKLISSLPYGIADCALIHNRMICFIEFKSNALGHSPETVDYTYDKAVSQLENTINHFDRLISAVGINLRATVEIACHVVVAPHFPRSTASEMNSIMKFAERNGAIELSFDDNRTF